MNKMTQMTKRLLILLAAVSSAAVLAACGSSEPTATDTTEDPAQVEAAAPETETTETVEVPEAPASEAVATEETDTTVAETSSETEASAEDTIVAIASGDSTFSTLVAAIGAAELEETLSGEGPYTVFAPTDEAFAALPEGTVEELLKPENKDQLIQVLTYHVVPAKVMSTEIQAGAVETVQGEPLAITVDPDTNAVMVNDATVVQADIVGSNGVIHAVDQVILPPGE